MRNKNFAFTILGLNVIAAWISWWILADAIYGRSAHSWLYPVLAFSFWGIVFTLNCIFVKNKTYIHSCFVASGLGYLIFIQPGWSWLVAPLAVLLLILTEKWTKNEAERGIKISFHHLASQSLKYFVSIVCLVVAVTYYFSITSRSAPTASIIEAKSLELEIDWGLKAASFILSDDKKQLIDDVRSNMTVDEFLLKNYGNPELAAGEFNISEISTNNPAEAAKTISGAAAQKIQEEMLSKAKKDLSKQLGVNVVGEQPVKYVLMAYIDKSERSFFEYSGSERFYLPIILAFGLFLATRIMGVIVDIFLGLFVLLIIKILRNSGIVSVKHEQKEVAMIEYQV